MQEFKVDILDKKTGKVVCTTTVRGLASMEDAVKHVGDTHPKNDVRAHESAEPDAKEPVQP